MYTRLMICLVLFSFCKPEVDESIQVAYQKNADLLCNAITECLKEEVAQRMESEPERRDLILKRMDRDLCLKNQYRLIGDRSTAISGSNPETEKDLYETYERCAVAVASYDTCARRKQEFETNTNCLKVRSESFTE